MYTLSQFYLDNLECFDFCQLRPAIEHFELKLVELPRYTFTENYCSCWVILTLRIGGHKCPISRALGTKWLTGDRQYLYQYVIPSMFKKLYRHTLSSPYQPPVGRNWLTCKISKKTPQ